MEFEFPAVYSRSDFTLNQLDRKYDLSVLEPGSREFKMVQVARYIALGGEFPDQDTLAFMKYEMPYPRYGGKRCFPNVGLTKYTREQYDRCRRLFVALDL